METLLSIDALRKAFDSMAEAVLIVDTHEGIVYQNEAATALCAEGVDALLKMLPSADLLVGADGPLKRALRGEAVRNHEVHVTDGKSGDIVTLLCNAVSISNDQDRAVRVVLNVRDVTKERRKERELEDIARALQQSNDDLEHFATSASHDLKEPLRMVGSFSQLLLRRNEGTLDEKSKEFVRYILTGVDRMDSLIRNLMEFSRLRAESAQSLSAVDCNLILGATLHDLQFKIQEAEATVTFDILPLILSNEMLIAQVFQNLIGNAVKYAIDKPQIHVSARRQGTDWLFSVKDNGIGIDPKDHDRIFVVFQRLHRRDEYSGSGIGLSICKRIVEQQKGRIWVESELGKGSTFYFTLPDLLKFSPQDRNLKTD